MSSKIEHRIKQPPSLLATKLPRFQAQDTVQYPTSSVRNTGILELAHLQGNAYGNIGLFITDRRTTGRLNCFSSDFLHFTYLKNQPKISSHTTADIFF